MINQHLDNEYVADDFLVHSAPYSYLRRTTYRCIFCKIIKGHFCKECLAERRTLTWLANRGNTFFEASWNWSQVGSLAYILHRIRECSVWSFAATLFSISVRRRKGIRWLFRNVISISCLSSERCWCIWYCRSLPQNGSSSGWVPDWSRSSGQKDRSCDRLRGL